MNIHPLNLGLVQAYLVETPGGLVLIDCGMPRQEEKVLRAVEDLGRGGIRLIFITHAHVDHYGSAAALARLTGAPVAVHRADAQAMANGETPVRTTNPLMRMATALMARLSPTPPVAADILLQDGDSLAEHDLPSVVVHTPGHTAGSCCLLLDDGVAFVGDMISAGKEPHLQRTFVDDPEALRRSYARLRGLPLSTVYSGHGDRVLTGVQVTRLIDAAYPA